MGQTEEQIRGAIGTESAHVCERCGQPMEERQCKIVCRNCGYSRDCSDP